MAARTSQRVVSARSARAGSFKPANRRAFAREVQRDDAVSGSQVDFGPLGQYLGYYLRRLYDGYRKHFIAQAGDLDVQPREVGAIFVIGLNPGLTPSELSVALAMDGAQITAMLNMFEARGLLERRVSSVDARSRLVYLTAAGKKMLLRLRKLVGVFDREFAGDALTDAEMKQLIHLLAKLHAGVGE